MTDIMTGTSLDLAAIARETSARLLSLQAQADAIAKEIADAKTEADKIDWVSMTYEVKSIAPGAFFTLQEVVAHNQAHKATGVRRNPISEAIFEETSGILKQVGTVKQDDEVVLNGQYWTKIAFIGGIGQGKTLPSRGETASE
jgi:hypothetical protein